MPFIFSFVSRLWWGWFRRASYLGIEWYKERDKLPITRFDVKDTTT